MKRTDLAMEIAGSGMPGVEVVQEDDGIKLTRVRITSELGERQMSKPRGTYVTLEHSNLSNPEPHLRIELAEKLGHELRAILDSHAESEAPTMIVGLGNRGVTPDALGPMTADKTLVTRHVMEALPGQLDRRMGAVCAVSPGVLGVTGIETLEIVKGVVERVKPRAVIAIDALAAAETCRIATTIQIADSGVSPGSGVGNHRRALSRETLGVPVIAVGVPTVVYASTIVRDALTHMLETGGDEPGSAQRVEGLVNRVVQEKIGEMVVTPREVDHLMDTLSYIVALGINLSLHDISADEIESMM